MPDRLRLIGAGSLACVVWLGACEPRSGGGGGDSVGWAYFGANLCLILAVTCLTWAADNRPSVEASDASIVAILALRTMEGTGRPASCRLATGRSSGQPRFSALVIMTTHKSPCRSWS